MKYEVTSQNTRKMFAEALKKRMENQPFNKIKISDITSDCKVNRKTFYYHFNDIYALLKWTFNQEAIDIVKHYDLLTNMQDAIIFVIGYIEENKKILKCALDFIGPLELKKIFYKDFFAIVHLYVGRCMEEKKYKISADFISFLCNGYAELIAGLIIDESFYEGKIDKQKIVTYITTIIDSSISAVLQSAQKKEM
ncbi:MAG TPA: TetR family transcriptional regulator [Treponema sp.]|nr:TetR family transcriptional regulator [Treponema sp.]